MPKTELITYAKKHNVPFGVVVAVKIFDKVYMGWSKCNKNDTFRRKQGRISALVRADAIYRGKYCPYPCSLRKEMKQLKETAKEYFGIEVEKLEMKIPVKKTPVIESYSREEIEQEVIKIVVRQLGGYDTTITLGTLLYSNISLDDVDIKEILCYCEGQFDTNLREETGCFKRFKTVKDLVDTIEEGEK